MHTKAPVRIRLTDFLAMIDAECGGNPSTISDISTVLMTDGKLALEVCIGGRSFILYQGADMLLYYTLTPAIE